MVQSFRFSPRPGSAVVGSSRTREAGDDCPAAESVPFGLLEEQVAYVVLAVAILSEVVGTVSLKFIDGLSRPLPLIAVVLGYGFAFVALASVLKMGLPVSVAYAIWSGAGVALVAVIGAVFLGENITLLQVGGIALIVGGVAALELGGAH